MKRSIFCLPNNEILIQANFETELWSQKQRQNHSAHYITPYRGCFAPQIPQFFIRKFSEEQDKVLDPFCGRGTTILEANLNNRIGIGFDISPLAVTISKAKLKQVTYEEVKERLTEIDFSRKRLDEYEKFKYIFHKETYSQILNLREQLTKSRVDTFIKSIVLGRLHGHSPGFFSGIFTFNVISPRINWFRKACKIRHIKPEFRDIVSIILKKSKIVLQDKIIEQKGSFVKIADARKLPLPSKSIQLILTSPPFLSTINYIDDNWLRFWFLGYDDKYLEKLRKKLIQTNNLEKYTQFIFKCMKEMKRVLKDDGVCVIEVGDVNHYSKKINLDELIINLAPQVGFKVKSLIINHIKAPRISNALIKDKKHGVKTNRCIILEK